MTTDLDTAVKLAIYRTIAETTRAPASTDVASMLGHSSSEVEDAFARLCARRLLVLEPGRSSQIRMAPPFSGIRTAHRVAVGGKSYFANCAWDAFGVAAALHADARVDSACGDCGQALTFEIHDGKPVPQPCAVHFAVPAARWWDDIIHT